MLQSQHRISDRKIESLELPEGVPKELAKERFRREGDEATCSSGHDQMLASRPLSVVL